MTRIAPSEALKIVSPGGPAQPGTSPAAAAREFEAAFAAEMLKHSGVGRAVASDSGFGGEAMASFLVEEIGRLIAERGGFGVAEMIERRLDRAQ
ncbi:MAG TPA: flagellar biosynthesis protein FlgJ [Parvularcula sp.]|nr:flagellar biosynthesis protein FlgJ [Parvularcula sp.]HBS30963.1 flagellar biosynthesis protein FlgJ [Parvularcula sp.]